jgi:hypothetical protein
MARLKRDAISRSRFLLGLAKDCPYSGEVGELEQFESYLEAALIFGRVAIHRVHAAAKQRAQANPSLGEEVKAWWDSLLEDPSVNFFRTERDFILKQGPPKVGQIIKLGLEETAYRKAEEHYYFEGPEIPATKSVEHHLNFVEEIVVAAEERFGTSTLLGR